MPENQLEDWLPEHKVHFSFDPLHGKTNNFNFEPSEGSDQPDQFSLSA